MLYYLKRIKEINLIIINRDSKYILFELHLDLRVLSSKAIDVVLHIGVPGGAEEAAGNGRLLHAEDVRLADVVDVHQRHGAQRGLHELEDAMGELTAGERRHDHRDAQRVVGLDAIAADERARQGHHLECRPLRLVVTQQLLLGEGLG